mmetsp:Transcript_139285/g.240719  ORF Transcript_139285/g.240719 Transcript_139285/m.240719 type:complete len:114 (-) Transcript_139285:307-648(-)
MSTAFMGSVRPVVFELEIALGAAARAARGTTAKVLPAISLLPQQLRFHPSFYRNLCLPRVGAIAAQLHSGEGGKLFHVVEWPIGIGWKRWETRAKHTGDTLVDKLLASFPDHL